MAQVYLEGLPLVITDVQTILPSVSTYRSVFLPSSSILCNACVIGNYNGC